MNELFTSAGYERKYLEELPDTSTMSKLRAIVMENAMFMKKKEGY